MLGQWDDPPSDPPYYIEDCRISGIHDNSGNNSGDQKFKKIYLPSKVQRYPSFFLSAEKSSMLYFVISSSKVDSSFKYKAMKDSAPSSDAKKSPDPRLHSEGPSGSNGWDP